MKITHDELREGYRNMSDEELLSLERADLTDVALKIHDQELERRGLSLEPEVEEPAADVSFQSYDSLDEAGAVQSLLESAGIPAQVENDTMRRMGFLVMVPASMVEDARQVLKAPETVADADAIIVKARYEDGVFVPLQEVDIRDGAEVEVHVHPSDIL